MIKSKDQYDAYVTVSGNIDSVFVSEGDTVKKGDPILSIADIIAQTEAAKPLVLKKNRLGIVSNGLNNDFLLGSYIEIGLSHEGHLGGFSSSTIHVTYLTNSVAKGIVLRPELRFYLKEFSTVLDQGIYISLGGGFTYVNGKGLPGAPTDGTIDLYRLGLTAGLGYQYTFPNNIFVNGGVLSGIATGIYKTPDTPTQTDLWYSENKSHPLFSSLTALVRVGYAF